MTLDLIRALLLLGGFLLYGPPDRWDVAVQGVLVLSPDGLAVEVLVDPVTVYVRVPPSGYCGMSYGQVVLVHPDPASLGCSSTLEHELAHVWQWRGWGLLPFGYTEPPEPWHQIPAAPRVMRHGLIRISVPLR